MTSTLDPIGAAVRRWHVKAQAVFPRPRTEVWSELVADDHPAWHEASLTSRRVEGPQASEVGASTVCVSAPVGEAGIRLPMLSTVIHVVPGYSRTVETLTGTMEHRETIQLADQGEEGALLTLEGWFTMICSAEHEVKAAAHFQGAAQEYLDRAAHYRAP
jgi:hypothetical protein